MSSLNKVQLIGNLGKDPEIRQSRDGRPIANFSIATSESWRDKATGDKQEKTEWHNIVCFNENLTKIIEQYLAKGSKVYVEGKLQTRKWQDRDGNDRYSTEVVMQGFDCKLVMLGGRGDGESRGGGKDENRDDDGGERRSSSGGGKRAAQNDMDDEIPFNFGAGRSLVRPLQKMAA